jgi:hypothetical protein
MLAEVANLLTKEYTSNGEDASYTFSLSVSHHGTSCNLIMVQVGYIEVPIHFEFDAGIL